MMMMMMIVITIINIAERDTSVPCDYYKNCARNVLNWLHFRPSALSRRLLRVHLTSGVFT